jgi:tetratricopeptide (TPR) repeat protein
MAARSLVWLYSYWIPDSGESEAMVERYYNRALESAEIVNDIIISLGATVARALHSNWRGRFTEARFFSSKLVELGRRFRDTRSLSYAQWSLGFINLFEERYEEALENAEQSLQLSPDLLDELCASAAKGGALALTGRVSEGLEILSKVRREIIESRFLLLLAAVDLRLGIAMALAGQMEKGVNHINDGMKYWASLGNYPQPVWGHLFLGDIYTRMAMGEMELRFGTILRNLWFILRTLPLAHRKARYHYEEVVRSAKAYNMPGLLAKALYGLGLLSQSKKEYKKASLYFEEALRVAETSELYIAGKIRSALNSLEKSES